MEKKKQIDNQNESLIDDAVESAGKVLSGAMSEFTDMTNEAGKHVREIHDEFVRRVAMIAIAAVGLIAALAWDDFLKTLFEKMMPENLPIVSHLVYALALTFVAALFAIGMRKLVPWYNRLWSRKNKEKK